MIKTIHLNPAVVLCVSPLVFILLLLASDEEDLPFGSNRKAWFAIGDWRGVRRKTADINMNIGWRKGHCLVDGGRLKTRTSQRGLNNSSLLFLSCFWFFPCCIVSSLMQISPIPSWAGDFDGPADMKATISLNSFYPFFFLFIGQKIMKILCVFPWLVEFHLNVISFKKIRPSKICFLLSKKSLACFFEY